MKEWKVVLSKKGFDDSTGENPSIILPEEYKFQMISFPIPEVNPTRIGFSAKDLEYHLENNKTKTLQQFFDELELSFPSDSFHYDPELLITNKLRKDKNKNYYATLGQSSTASSVLLDSAHADTKSRNPLSKDDVMLFFGTFKRTYLENGKLKYDSQMHKIHAIWGYMIVDDVIQVLNDGRLVIPNTKKQGPFEDITPDILEKYPHIQEHLHYINRNKEEFPNIIVLSKRFDTFKYKSINKLTKSDYNRTVWQLPDFLQGAKMGYQKNTKDNLIKDPSRILINGHGQELVISNFNNDEMKKWLKDLGVPL